jgi:hypothetical protein
VVAVGYDYELDAGLSFASVLPPAGIGDGLYDLFLFDANVGCAITHSLRFSLMIAT